MSHAPVSISDESQIEHSSRPGSLRVDFTGELARWLFFVSGIALLISAWVLPASADLKEARFQRDTMLVIQQDHKVRLDRYRMFLERVENPDPQTLALLAHTQLGIIPGGVEALLLADGTSDLPLLDQIEPVPGVRPAPPGQGSRLQQLTTDPQTRFWVVIVGALAVFFGILPAAKS